MRTISFLVLCLLASSPALAAATDWKELAPDTRIRLIASEKLGPDGTTLVAIELDMPADTKTYWRVPGETGIAATIDLAGSRGIVEQRVLWPYPQVEEKEGYTDFVHYGPTVLPVKLKAEGGTAELRASILLGICSDICIPASADFSLPLDFATPDAGQDLRIAQAMAVVPLAWTGAADAIGDVTFDPVSAMLHVPLGGDEIDPLSIVVDAGNTGHLFGAPQKSREEKVVVLPLLGGANAKDLDGQSVELVFMTRNGPFELSRRISASTPAGQ